VQIALLGPLEVRGPAGSLVEVRGSRLRALLILLALDAGRVVTTGRLTGALWEDQFPAAAANALQALVSRLRRALPEAVITAHPAGYQLMIDPGQVDVAQFERLAADGHAALREDPGRAAHLLREALALWRGPALADVAEADFAAAAIARLTERRLTAIQDRVDADLRLGPATPLVAELEGLVAAYPLREPLIGALMRALAASGQPGAALAVFEQARARLADELGTGPSPALAALHLSILRAEDQPAAPDGHAPAAASPAGHSSSATVPGARADAASPAPAAAPATNLRAQLTSFVGRDTEIAEVRQLVGGNRLITLTGPGGAGKTRLAVEAGRAELAAMPGGVWLAELAPVTDPADVPQAVLAALGLRERALVLAGRSAGAADEAEAPLDRLVSALGSKRALLVLDNCEHLLGAAAVLADRVLSSCPQMRILATSREPLNITGEMLWPVGPLALPPDGPEPAPDEIAACASVRLLVQRARAARPGFEVTRANAAAVAGICRALDGMPLAIELAAARLRAMSPEQVASRLDDRFRLLTGGSRTAMPRHQTLRAVVDWSWDLLSDAERAVWRRFAVFTGGAGLAAAEQVCAGGPAPAADVLDLLTALVEKSLLTVRDGPDGPRYLMLEIIRAYGQERNAEAGEQDATREAHARFCRALVTAARDELLAADQLIWLNRLSADQDNLHHAIRSAVAAGDADTAIGLAGDLGWYWWLRGLKAEGAELIADALTLAGRAAAEPAAVARTMGALLAMDDDDNMMAVGKFAQAAELAATVDHPQNPVLRLVIPLAEVVKIAVGTQGQSVPTDLLDGVAADPDPWMRSVARVMRGHMGLNFGHGHHEAEADFQAALATFRELGERWGMAFSLTSVATLAMWRGDFTAAAADLQESLALTSELGTNEDLVYFRLQLARCWWLLDQHELSRATMTQARQEAERIGLPSMKALAALVAADQHRLDGELAESREALTEAAGLMPAMKTSLQLQAMLAAAEAQLAAAEGDLAAGREHLAAAMAAAVSSKDRPVLAAVVIAAADLACREGDADRAARLLGASIPARGAEDRSAADVPRVARAARAVLGDEAYDSAFGAGRASTLEDVLALAGPG
jgi:predicted ATPase/DNA-binding SARP family transcriptional activator